MGRKGRKGFRASKGPNGFLLWVMKEFIPKMKEDAGIELSLQEACGKSGQVWEEMADEVKQYWKNEAKEQTRELKLDPSAVEEHRHRTYQPPEGIAKDKALQRNLVCYRLDHNTFYKRRLRDIKKIVDGWSWAECEHGGTKILGISDKLDLLGQQEMHFLTVTPYLYLEKLTDMKDSVCVPMELTMITFTLENGVSTEPKSWLIGLDRDTDPELFDKISEKCDKEQVQQPIESTDKRATKKFHIRHDYRHVLGSLKKRIAGQKMILIKSAQYNHFMLSIRWLTQKAYPNRTDVELLGLEQAVCIEDYLMALKIYLKRDSKEVDPAGDKMVMMDQGLEILCLQDSKNNMYGFLQPNIHESCTFHTRNRNADSAACAQNVGLKYLHTCFRMLSEICRLDLPLGSLSTISEENDTPVGPPKTSSAPYFDSEQKGDEFWATTPHSTDTGIPETSSAAAFPTPPTDEKGPDPPTPTQNKPANRKSIGQLFLQSVRFKRIEDE